MRAKTREWKRVAKLQTEMRKRKLDAFFVVRASNLHYLFNFMPSSGFGIVWPDHAVFVTDFRYETAAQSAVRGAKVIIHRGPMMDELKKNRQLRLEGKVAMEADHMTVDFFEALKSYNPHAQLRPLTNVVEEIAACKEPEELANIQQAIAITERVLSEIVGMLRPGLVEADLAAEVSYRHRKYGASGDSFDSIIASGKNSALPHAEPGKKKIQKGDFVTFDIGCVYEGYASDITRTFVIGKATSRQRKIYGIVLRANQKAIRVAKAGMDGYDLDKVARDIIKNAGYGPKFGHGLGHGVGMEVHGFPRVSRLVHAKLKPNMVVTIEPGVYIPGWGGVRIEDDICIKRDGCEVMTSFPKELIEI
jgi:Xaa-Pro aminopeptidase